MREMGGPDVPGVGWAAGVERLAMLLPAAPAADRPVGDRPIGPEAGRGGCARPAAARRRRGRPPCQGKPGQRMKRADRIGARRVARRRRARAGRRTVARPWQRRRGGAAPGRTRRPACRLTGRPMVAPGFDSRLGRSWPAATSSKRCWPRSSRASTPAQEGRRTSGRWSRPSRPTPRGASCAISRR